jgi:DnaJ family protein A protein 2
MSSYKILGVADGASMQDVKKAYKKLAMMHHPDKGGDEELFKQITEAYQNIINPSPDPTPSPRHHQDFFHQNFSQAKASNKVYEIHVSIFDAYYGKEKKLSISNDLKCDKCAVACTACNGRGIVTMVINVFPGIQQRVSSKCGHCGGAGIKVVTKKDCSKCQGRGSIKETNIVVVNVRPGVNTNDIITYKGMGCTDPRQTPGDLIVRIIVDNSGMLKKDGVHMVYHKEIDFVDTFMGMEFMIKEYPTGVVKINTKDIKEVVRGGKRYTMKVGGGMPYINGSKTTYGDLMVEFTVRYNLDVSKLDRATLAPALAIARM